MIDLTRLFLAEPLHHTPLVRAGSAGLAAQAGI